MLAGRPRALPHLAALILRLTPVALEPPNPAAGPLAPVSVLLLCPWLSRTSTAPHTHLLWYHDPHPVILASVTAMGTNARVRSYTLHLYILEYSRLESPLRMGLSSSGLCQCPAWRPLVARSAACSRVPLTIMAPNLSCLTPSRAFVYRRFNS